MVYEAVRDIAAGEELFLGVREPLQLQDMFGENTTEDRSDRETGEYRTRDAMRSSREKGRGLVALSTLMCLFSERSSNRQSLLACESVTRSDNEITITRARWKFALQSWEARSIGSRNDCSPTDVTRRKRTRGERTDNQTH